MPYPSASKSVVPGYDRFFEAAQPAAGPCLDSRLYSLSFITSSKSRLRFTHYRCLLNGHRMQTPYSCGRFCRVQAQRGGIGSLNCPSKTPYYNMTLVQARTNLWRFCHDGCLAILGMSVGAGWNPVCDYSPGLIVLTKRESADSAPSRRHYADAQYFREAG